MVDRYDWHDIGYTALADADTTSNGIPCSFVNWHVVSIESWKMPTGEPDFEEETPEASPPMLAGAVKWDGCCDIDIGSGDPHQIHFCGISDVEGLAAMLRRVYEMTAWYCRERHHLSSLPEPRFWPSQPSPYAA